MMPDHAQPRPATASAGARPAGFTEHRRGIECPMCANDFAADDIGRGLLVRRGEVSNAYLWRSGQVRGYSVVICTGRHVAEPTEPDEEEAAAFWRDVLAPARIGLVLQARSWTGDPEVLEPDRCAEWRWWKPQDLPAAVVPYTRRAIVEVLQGRPYSEIGWGER